MNNIRCIKPLFNEVFYVVLSVMGFVLLLLSLVLVSLPILAQTTHETSLEALFNESALRDPSSPELQDQSDGFFTRKKQKAWYNKLNYFGNVTRETRKIEASRDTTNLALTNSELLVDYDTWLLSLTVGGNIFKRTSVNWDLTSEQYILEGALVETNLAGVRNESPVRFTRHKWLSEWFIEYDLTGGLTLGADLYHGQSRYRDSRIDEVFTDKEYGGGLLLSKKFKFSQADLRMDYILSYRRLDPGDEVFETQSRTFHSVLANYHYTFNFDWQADITARYSWYPTFDPENFWDARSIYSLGSELVYRPWDEHQFALKVEHVWIGDDDTMEIISFNYETEFGAKSDKRRKRRRRIPNLLIR